MSDVLTRAQLVEVLNNHFLPTVAMWNRLEGRPRADNFDRSMKAEIRDALWMLTRQWQMGEFEGDDAGTPVGAKIHYETSRLTKYRAHDQVTQVFEDDIPLETKVEQRAFPFAVGDQAISLDLRLQMGCRWLKLVAPLGNFATDFINAYPIAEPDATAVNDAMVCAHPEVWAQHLAVAGRAMDGYRLYQYLKEDASHHPYDTVAVPPGLQAAFDDRANRFITWFESLYFQPTDPVNNAWRPSRLEYAFSCSAPEPGGGETVFDADEYYHGHLDWYNLNVDRTVEELTGVEEVDAESVQEAVSRSFIPKQVEFEGMPDTRWWAFEDKRTSWAKVRPDTTDLASLLLIEFGLVYANDWFLLPLQLPVGSLTRIRGLTVTNVFGERTWIEPANETQSAGWNRWSMYSITRRQEQEPRDDLSILVPSVSVIQESKPLEVSTLARDEMANMVWGIETKVPLPDGNSKRGSEAGRELRDYLQRLIDDQVAAGVIAEEEPDYKAEIYYRVMNLVPENWIPFIPVHRAGSVRQTELQRASMPRILKNGPSPPDKVKPRTTIMREGLDELPAKPYFVCEEEVPRLGVSVTQSYQRARWLNGSVFVWMGRRKRTGHGESSSGLAFDQIVPVE